MAKIYFSLIIKNRKKFSDIPASQKEEVKQLLIEAGREDLINE